MKTYTGTITGEEELLLPFVNVYQAEAEPGSLTVQKEVVGDNPDPDKEFSFAITFSDGGTYEYTVDGGEPQELVSGGVLVLKSGQTAVFTNLPDGIPYTVKEIDAAGYLPAIIEAAGTIASGEAAVVKFQNRVPDEAEQPATLRVTKKLEGEYPEAEENKEFHFTLTVDGIAQEFTLKPGESKEFEIAAGAQYELTRTTLSRTAMPSCWKTASALLCPARRLPSPLPILMWERYRLKSKARKHGSWAAVTWPCRNLSPCS
ncbi:MAG: DUF5979 domain-containing protein [Clostridia bacterium]